MVKNDDIRHESHYIKIGDGCVDQTIYQFMNRFKYLLPYCDSTTTFVTIK